MEINRNNYEIIFMDYFDGKLQPEEVADLFLFLEEHPDLKKIFEDFENISIADQENISFPGKENLKKSLITAENFNEYAVADLENTLDQKGRKELQHFLTTHPEYGKEVKLFAATKLSVDKTIIYPDKESLKKKSKIIPFRISNWAYVAAAASIILIIGYFFFNNNTTAPVNTATNQNKTTQPVQKDQAQFSTQPSQQKEQVASVTSPVKKQNKVEATPATKKNKLNTHVEPQVAIVNKENTDSLSPQFAQADPVKPIENPSLENDSNTAVIPSAKKYQEINKENSSPVAVKTNREQYKSPGEALADLAVKKYHEIKKEDNDDPNSYVVQTPKKKFLDAVSWTLNKVSQNKVNLQTSYDPQGELMAYQLNVGNSNISKEISK